MAAKPAAGGGFWVEVAAERFTRWCDGFAERHGGLSGAVFGDAVPGNAVSADTVPGDTAFGAGAAAQVLELTATDGATASCHVPFGPIKADTIRTDTAALGESPQTAIDAVAAHALVDRSVGVLLVRRGGYAAGLFLGTRLLDHKVGSRYVQGKTKAGGWSQQRYARRREGQAREAYAAAAQAAEKVLLPVVETLDAVVTGGDAAAVAVLRGEARLARLWAKEREPFLNVGDPRLEDLRQCPQTFRAVRIRLIEPA